MDLFATCCWLLLFFSDTYSHGVYQAYPECSVIESEIECNSAYYQNLYGCYWDGSSLGNTINPTPSCKCKLEQDKEINVLFLIDISILSIPSGQHFQYIQNIIADTIKSTITERNYISIILYDEDVHISLSFDESNSMTIAEIAQFVLDIDISAIPRTQNTHQLQAIVLSIIEFTSITDSTSTDQNAIILFSAEGNRNKNAMDICNLAFYLNMYSTYIFISSSCYSLQTIHISQTFQCLLHPPTRSLIHFRICDA